MIESHRVVWTPEKIAATWDFFSRMERDQYFSAHSGRSIVERVDRELGLRDKRVLDFGCGRGDLLQHLFARGIPAQGLEFSEESAQTTAARFGHDPAFRGIASSPDELASDSADVIFLVEVIEHLLDDQIAPTLAEVRRLLAPDGALVVTCPNDEDLTAESLRCPDCGAMFHRWQHMRALNPRTIAELFEQHGFRTHTSEAVYWGMTRWRLRARQPFARHLPAPHLFYIGTA